MTRTNPRPTHPLALSDGVTTIGLTLCDPRGTPDPRAIREVPMPKTSMQITQGDPTYGSMQMPFSTIVQKDWSGGRGLLEFAKDGTRYYDSQGVDARMGDVILNPKVTDSTGILFVGGTAWVDNAEGVTPGTGTTGVLTSYTAASPLSIRHLATRVRFGPVSGAEGGQFRAVIFSDVAGAPGNQLAIGDGVYRDTNLNAFTIWLPINYTFTLGVKYWIGVWFSSSELWQLRYRYNNNNPGEKIYTYDGNFWNLAQSNACLLIQTLSSGLGMSRLFEYRESQMTVSRPDDFSPAKLYLNGYHGMAKANADNKGVLLTDIDLSGAGSLAGKIIKIVAGPGSEEPTNWRVIKLNTVTANNNTITVEQPWRVAHTTATEFAILGCDTWKEIGGHGLTAPVTDILVVDDIIYFCQGDTTVIRRGKFNQVGDMTNAAQWSWANESNIDATWKGASFIDLVNDSSGVRKIWMAQATTCKVYSSDVKAWGTALVYSTAIVCGRPQHKITNIIAYGTPPALWIIKEDEFGAITNNIYGPVPLSELRSVRSDNNGRGAITFGVYLFFSLGLDGWERYLDNRLDDIGPNHDEGLPPGRHGVLATAVPYPGGIICAVDGGTDGYSSILYWNQIGWHEVYRAAQLGDRIRSLQVQVLPGSPIQRLWFCQGEDIKYLQLSVNPSKQAGYQFVSSGSLITSWYQATFGEINKYWANLTLHTDGLIAEHQTIEAYYQTDAEDDSSPWHLIGAFTVSPSQALPISTGHNVAGKRIRFKLVLATDDPTKTPRLKAMTLQAVTRVPPATSWSITFLSASHMQDQQGRWEDINEAQLSAQLAHWANSDEHAIPLLMTSADPAYNDRYVFIDAGSVMPLEITVEANRKVRTVKAITMSIFEAED